MKPATVRTDVETACPVPAWRKATLVFTAARVCAVHAVRPASGVQIEQLTARGIVRAPVSGGDYTFDEPLWLARGQSIVIRAANQSSEEARLRVVVELQTERRTN